MFNLVLLLGSLRLASANTWPWSPPEEPRTVHLTQHLVQISHLSPLLHYTPVDAWTFTAQGAFTDQPGANVSLHYMGSQLAIMGYRSGAVDLDISPLVPERYPGTEEDNYRFVPPGSTSGVLLHMNGGGNVTYERRLVSFQLPKVEEGEEEDSPFAPLTVQGVRMSSVLPSDWHVNEEPHSDNLHLEVAVHDDGMNAFFQSTPETWTIETSSPPSDDFTLVPGPGGAYEAGLSGTTWPRSVLSTSTHFASLTFDVPERASILQLYGNVGPNLGKARLIIEANPESPTPVNFHDDSMTGIVINAERPMEASGQLLGLVWLDPRTRYKAVLSLDDVRPGKAFQLAGVTTKQYIADGGSVQGDWLAEWNKEFGTRWTPPPPPPPPSRPARPSRSRSPPPQRHNATPVPSSVDENPKKEIPGIPLEYTAYGWYLLIIPVLCLYWLFSRASRSSDPAEKQPIMSAIDTSVASVVPSRLTYGSYDEEALRSARMARRPDSSARAPTPRSPISVGITSPSGRVSVPPPAYVARGRA